MSNSKYDQKFDETTLKIVSVLQSFARWSKIYGFIEKNGYVEMETDQDIIAQNRRALVDTDFLIMALLLYLRANQLKNKEREGPFTLRSLAKVIDGESDKSINKAQSKIRRTLKKTKHFGIFSLREGIHIGKRKCLYIEPTKLLYRFFEEVYFIVDKA